MAYLIYSRRTKYTKLLKSILSKAPFVVIDTEFPECILVMRDPSAFIPAEIRPHIQIIETKDYKQYLKGFDLLASLIKPSKTFKQGDVVRIIKGPYQGMEGLVKQINEKDLEIEIAVFGRIIKDIFEFDEVEKVNKIF